MRPARQVIEQVKAPAGPDLREAARPVPKSCTLMSPYAWGLLCFLIYRGNHRSHSCRCSGPQGCKKGATYRARHRLVLKAQQGFKVAKPVNGSGEGNYFSGLRVVFNEEPPSPRPPSLLQELGLICLKVLRIEPRASRKLGKAMPPAQ